MTLWRKTRTEMAGAWRSLRYDLGRREEPGHEPPVLRPGHPDVTSTGMSTFGGVEETAWPGCTAGTHRRPPRRLVAVTAFGALAVAGAAGSYLAVVNGLGGLLAEEPAAAEPYPLAIGGEPERDQVASNAGIGQGRAERPVPAPAMPAAAVAPGVPVQKITQPAPLVTTVTKTVPVPNAPVPTSPACDCLEPPVPTPTDVPSSTPSPDASEPEPPVPTDSASSPTPTDSASGEPSASSESGRAHRRR
ncbi:hypothetical protein [Actinoplanes sp. NPDC049265]|uniref:hypothetical protein n=1 Tax=Actinoplanes sp. NPDC049265 TaxID=3363902 RepID=UPI00371379C2